MTVGRKPISDMGEIAESDSDPVLSSALDLGPLPRLAGYALRRAQLAVFEDFITTLAELDLRPAQYSVLLVLERNPGSTQTAVAAALGIQRANFVALLDGLERKGLARRAPSPTDRRSHALGLTPRGHEVLVRANTLVAQHDARMIAGVGVERWTDVLAVLHALSERG
jgi:DNA-binding MarR family transcriptional regulator